MRLHRDAKAELIRSVPLFADCSPDEVAEVAAIADEIDLRAGKDLTTESTDGREFVVMVEGSAEVTQGGSVINTLGPGDWFGEIALLTGKPRTATVRATSTVHALVIEGHRFTQLLEHAPDIRAKVERVFAQRSE
ncbi:MAG: cyclic nucleotide-binding domain-containing protein [Nocardioidaceae bacterium]|nr:cyclic nucleotide-binding domain-containing protein [Nocardioidaceae bacterium]